jgi:hypothetical protein
MKLNRKQGAQKYVSDLRKNKHAVISFEVITAVVSKLVSCGL